MDITDKQILKIISKYILKERGSSVDRAKLYDHFMGKPKAGSFYENSKLAEYDILLIDLYNNGYLRSLQVNRDGNSAGGGWQYLLSEKAYLYITPFYKKSETWIIFATVLTALFTGIQAFGGIDLIKFLTNII